MQPIFEQPIRDMLDEWQNYQRAAIAFAERAMQRAYSVRGTLEGEWRGGCYFLKDMPFDVCIIPKDDEVLLRWNSPQTGEQRTLMIVLPTAEGEKCVAFDQYLQDVVTHSGEWAR